MDQAILLLVARQQNDRPERAGGESDEQVGLPLDGPQFARRKGKWIRAHDDRSPTFQLQGPVDAVKGHKSRAGRIEEEAESGPRRRWRPFDRSRKGMIDSSVLPGAEQRVVKNAFANGYRRGITGKARHGN